MFNSEDIQITDLKTEDAESLFRLFNSNKEHFGTYLPITLSENQSVLDSEAYILKKSEENKKMSSLTFAIKEKTTESIAGLIILKNIKTSRKQAEFAYGIGKAFEGKKWTTQAVKLMTTYAFNDLGLKKLQIITHKDNKASCKVAENCGFQWKRTLKNEFTPPGGTSVDMELYELYK